MLFQVVAHPDDDLLFMNPDVDTGVVAGLPTTTVFVTSGHAGLTGNEAAERVRNRQRGIQDAYRISADVPDLPDQDEWDGEVLTVADRHVEQYRLRDRPDVAVVFLGLPDGTLSTLVQGAVLETVPAAGGLVVDPQFYDAGTVVDVLMALMQHFQPTVLGVTDLFDDPRFGFGSHPDHQTAAALAVQASEVYREAAGTWLPTLVEFRDYDISESPVNLDPSARTRKNMLFTDAYQPWDPAAIDDVGWTDRMYYRHPHGTEWSAVDGDGVVHLFVVRDGILQDWHGQGGVWSGPVELGDHVARVTALRDENGEIQVAVRTTDDRVATRPVGAGDWTDLGTHNPGAGARHFGTPVLASNADGRLQVFAVNAGGGLSSRWQTGNGDWVDWEDFEGTDLLDPCNALLDSSGRIEVIAATRTGLTLWRQTVPNGSIVRGPIPGLAPASPATFAVNADGRPEVHYREAGSADVATELAGRRLRLALQYQPRRARWGRTSGDRHRRREDRHRRPQPRWRRVRGDADRPGRRIRSLAGPGRVRHRLPDGRRDAGRPAPRRSDPRRRIAPPSHPVHSRAVGAVADHQRPSVRPGLISTDRKAAVPPARPGPHSPRAHPGGNHRSRSGRSAAVATARPPGRRLRRPGEPQPLLWRPASAPASSNSTPWTR